MSPRGQSKVEFNYPASLDSKQLMRLAFTQYAWKQFSATTGSQTAPVGAAGLTFNAVR